MAFMAKSTLIDREKNRGVDITREKFSSPFFSSILDLSCYYRRKRKKTERGATTTQVQAYILLPS
jgi:hypothetical protein